MRCSTTSKASCCRETSENCGLRGARLRARADRRPVADAGRAGYRARASLADAACRRRLPRAYRPHRHPATKGADRPAGRSGTGGRGGHPAGGQRQPAGLAGASGGECRGRVQRRFRISILGVSEPGLTLWFAFAGAATAAAAVYGLGQSAGGTTQTLLLAGAVAGGFLTALTTVVLIYDQNALDQVRLWTAGSLSGRRMTDVAAIAPFLLAALAAALLLRRQIMVLSLGRDVAHGLGQNRRLWLAIALILSVLLSGGAVALAGPVSFVGLVAPHLVRLVAGADYRVLLPAAALTGPVLLLGADTAGHWLSASAAFPVGISTALLGAPFFIWLARRGTGGAR
uniref:Iron ABC transporter permease n=1 Tax=Alloyangia mangrovi TaxID=1779329 RepID=A0A2A3JZ91_9RHOB